MTPNDYIDKAIHAINTDQPNLAMLYMKRGYKEMQRLRPDTLLDFIQAMQNFNVVFEQINNRLLAIGNAMVNAVQDTMKVSLLKCCDGRYGDSCRCDCHKANFALVN